ncbi:MAG: hypothetical protein ACKO0Z_25290 [Betaproteobacteria bacterium]
MTEIDRAYSNDIVAEKVVTTADGDWNALARQIHQDNVAKGFWPGGISARNVGELLALVHSELSEAYEAIQSMAFDDKLPEFPAFDVEIADAMIRLLDAGAAYEVDMNEVVENVPFNPYEGVAHHIAVAHLLVSNALEAHRKGRTEDFKSAVSETFHYLVNTCFHYNSDFEVIDAKLAYNRSRPFMHGKKY